MNVTRTLTICTVLAAATPAVRSQGTAAADPVERAHQDIASLIPADAAAVARLASIDHVLQFANEVAKAAGRESPLTADRLLGRLWPMPGKHELIDLHLPIVLAVSLPRATPPAPVLIVPTTDAAAYSASLVELGMSPAVAGSYVALPLAGKYSKPAAASNLLASLPDGTLAVYADADKLTAAFGKVIGATLTAAKATFAQQLERNSPGIDGEALAELYLDGVRSILACAKTVRFGVGYRDGKLDLFGTLQVKAGSDMAGWSSAPLDVAASGVAPSGNGSIELLMGADWQHLWPHFQSLVDRLADVYPKATGDALRTAVADYAPLYAAVGPFVALDGDVFAANGIGATLSARPTDVAALRNAVDAICGKEWFGTIGVTIGAVRTAETGGAAIADRDVTVDLAKLSGALSLTLTDMGEVTKEQMLKAVLGGDRVALRVATKGQRAVVVVGNHPDAALAALDATARHCSKPVQDALARVADCSPFVVQRVDFGALIAAFARMAHRLDETLPMPEFPADATAAFVFAAGIRGDEWRAGVSIDVAGVARLNAATQPR